MAEKEFKSRENAYIIAQYYGFNGLDVPHVKKGDVEIAEKIRKVDPEYFCDKSHPLEETIAVLRNYQEKSMDKKPQPIMAYHEGQPRGSHKKRKLKTGEKKFGLHIIGTPKSVAEAILIQTTLSILEEEGYKDLSVEINSVGDKESKKVFEKELTAHLRKNINSMNATCRELMKKGPYSVITCKSLAQDIRESAPDSISLLTDDCCNHLKEVVEFLEKNEIPYTINKDVIGNPHYASDTIFTILDEKTGKILATGSRYDTLAKESGLKKSLPAAGVSIKYTRKGKKKNLKPFSKPKFYFTQIGPEAKAKSFKVIETLRKANIPIDQAIIKDKISTQMSQAKARDYDYVIIMGQYEAMQDKVLVRNTDTHEQESVAIDELAKYLKKLK